MDQKPQKMSKKIKIEVPNCKDCKVKDCSALFCNLSIDELEKLSYYKQDNFYKKGQAIFTKGKKSSNLFCIHKGKVKVYKLGAEGKEQIVRFANTGDLLGYRSLLSEEPYQASAIAMEDSIICALSKHNFNEILRNNNNLALKTIHLLASDLKESEKKMIHITQKPVIERVSEALLILKEKFNFDVDGKTLNISLTRREIGDIAGVTTETTIRTLSDLKKENIIHLKGKHIEITNLPKLVNFANISD